MKKLLLLFTFCIFQLSILFSQCCPYLDDAYIIPENPTTADHIYLVTTVTTPNEGLYLGYDITELPDNAILVEACYWEGMFTTLKTFVDTINLGLRPAGSYTVDFKAISSIDATTCNPIDSTATQVEFEVSGSNPTKEISKGSSLRCFPNPLTTDLLYLESEIPLQQIEIVNANGVTAYRKEYFSEKNIELNLADLSNGVYFIKTIDLENNNSVRKIIKVK